MTVQRRHLAFLVPLWVGNLVLADRSTKAGK